MDLEVHRQGLLERSVAGLGGITESGDTVSLTPTTGLRLLYVFNRDCPVCQHIKEDVADSAARLSDRFLSIALNDDTLVFDYWELSTNPQTLVLLPTPEVRSRIGSSGTPTFLAVDSVGTVRAAQIGYRSRAITIANVVSAVENF